MYRKTKPFYLKPITKNKVLGQTKELFRYIINYFRNKKDIICPQNKILFNFVIIQIKSMNKPLVTSFGEKLRSMREKKNFTLRDLSINVGIDSSLLGKIERNERQPTKGQIKTLAIFFNFSETDLIKELISDEFAYKIIESDLDKEILKFTEKKIEYLKNKK